MPESSDGSESTGGVSNQLAYLVPSFDPSKGDLQMYQQKVQLILSMWPQGKINELVTRLILNTTGSAFAKLQLHSTELCVNDAKQVQRLIELLGGHWGKTGLEKRYADAERALFQCQQQSDESHDSYLARADVLWSKLKAQKLQIDDLQAYITLRGAQLSSDDKKRIILDSDSSLEGTLTVGRVRDAVRMLGTSFFQEMTGLGKKLNKSKVYDSLAMVSEDHEVPGDQEESAYGVNHEDWTEEDALELLIAEGDDDAVFIADFEAAASDLIQSDEDLSAAYSTYVEARRKLSEKYRARGFWPISKGKSRGKGKTKGKVPWSSRKSLQQRIAESNCRLCGKKGHWRNECPLKNQGSSASQSTAAVTVSLASQGFSSDSAMPDEFMNLPEVADSTTKDILSDASCFVQTVFSIGRRNEHPSTINPPSNIRVLREKIRNHIEGNKESNFGVKSLVHRIEMKLKQQAKSTSLPQTTMVPAQRILRSDRVREPLQKFRSSHDCSQATVSGMQSPVESPITTTASAEGDILFATHDTWGILDTGATKTVMGSDHVKDFLSHLHPSVKSQVKRSTSNVVFRFGNQGTLQASHALVVPVCGMRLKISIVKGATPFLISNTLLRALGALVDTSNHQLILPKFKAQISLQLTPKGLYLIDMNQLMNISPVPGRLDSAAETYAQDDHLCGQNQSAESVPIAPQATLKPDVSDKSQNNQVSNLTFDHQENQFQFSTFSQVTQQSDEFPQVAKPDSPNFQSTNEKPVIHGNASANVQHGRFCSQEPPALIRPEVNVDRHVQSCPAPEPSASILAASGAGVHRAPDHLRPEGRADDLRPNPFGENLPRDVVQSSRLDSLVRCSLPHQRQNRTSEDGPLHLSQDRGVRRQCGGDPTADPQSQGGAQVTCSKTEVSGCSILNKVLGCGHRGRNVRDDERDTMGQPEETKEEIRSIQERMTTLESTLHQMMAMIAQSPLVQNRSAPTTASTAEIPESVWDDPWNN
eukprot:s2140_g9.t1